MFEIREATIGPDHRRCHAVVLVGPETADESKQSINDARDRSIDNEQWEHWGLDADAVVIVADREEQPWTLPMVWSKVMERDEHPFARVFVAEPEDGHRRLHRRWEQRPDRQSRRTPGRETGESSDWRTDGAGESRGGPPRSQNHWPRERSEGKKKWAAWARTGCSAVAATASGTEVGYGLPIGARFVGTRRVGLRTALEGSRGMTVANRLALTPSIELGVRQDGGDADVGAGLDLAAGLMLADSVTGLAVDLRVRRLLVHQTAGFAESGMAISVSYNPSPSTPLGFTARVAPAWGSDAMSGAEALWGRDTMERHGNRRRAAPPGAEERTPRTPRWATDCPWAAGSWGRPGWASGPQSTSRDYRARLRRCRSSRRASSGCRSA